MRRGYRCAFFLAVLFACLAFSGCKSGGTAALAVATTALPNGAIGAPYTAALTATGGTPGYRWSEVSGGAMPGGISLAGNGIFNGTPTATGTFGPYVFQVKDSTGAAVSTGSLGITITSASLSIVTSSLPQGAVNTPYSVALQASGGAPPYSWSLATGGAMPAGKAHNPRGGGVCGHPPTPRTYG